MDVLQAVSSATQIVSCMVEAVNALEQASRDLDDAPRRIGELENFVFGLENLTRDLKETHGHKLHNLKLAHQIRSLAGLIEQLRPKLRKARKTISKSKMKNMAKVVWFAVSGDPFSKLVDAIRTDLTCWIEFQKISENLIKTVESTAKKVPLLLKVNIDQGFPVSNKCHLIQQLLEQAGTRRVILIVGLSGIGKSFLARQVASNPPKMFVHGAVELRFGQSCSRAACNGSRTEYHRRLAKKICRLLVQIGFIEKMKEEMTMDIEEICGMLQSALVGKSILLLLDDVWEQDIVERFTRLYDNDCRYLITTRNEGVYEISEAEKVEISKDDLKVISKEILLHHSLLTKEEIPAVAEDLLERCGHHPLTVAVIGKALRRETRIEKWEKAIHNLSTYATCAPGPISYVNEKEAENTLTIFGSFEFSLHSMSDDCQRFFISLAAISCTESVPEVCLEVIWSVLGPDSVFPLIICKLVEGSLLIKTETDPGYHVHDMVALYLESKASDAIEILLTRSSDETAATVVPWLLVFGVDEIKNVAEERLKLLICSFCDRQIVMTLESINQALMASKSISELEASSRRFNCIVGPKVADFILAGSSSIIAAFAKLITILLLEEGYYECALERPKVMDKLLELLENCEEPTAEASIFALIGKLAEHGNSRIVSEILPKLPMNQLLVLLSANAGEWHTPVFMTIMSLIKAGKFEAVQLMISSGVDRSLIHILRDGDEVAQHHAVVILKALHETGGPLDHLQCGTLELLPWNVRYSLERFMLSDRKIFLTPKPQIFEVSVRKILHGDTAEMLEAMQDLIPTIEKSGDERFREMILQSPLIEKLGVILSNEQNTVRSQSAFLLMKLACSGGELFIKKFFEFDIVPKLVKMMLCHVAELQDSAYTALHHMMHSAGGSLVLDQILKMDLVGKLTNSLCSQSVKTKEVGIQFVLDLVELGSKQCIEQIFSSQFLEKLVCVEKAGNSFKGVIVNFLKSLDKGKNLSAAERRVLKQQVIRKVRVFVKGHKLELNIIAAVEECVSEGKSWGGSSSKPKK